MSTFNVPDMSCGHCKAAIEKAVLAEDSQAQLGFDLESRTVNVTSRLEDTDLIALLAKEGYPATVSA
ncbi:heavy-metal-associated domain-containing protein [Aliiroseovarius sp.]|uniref:heavy-metal-associated domain-containing protein n=1 Tax=Aliiroseovarius sp. TaxID=1872442 RepID=UPI002608D61A|nr:heavy-metal-associated domain-containing protein [Aliiroseovarius sp.]